MIEPGSKPEIAIVLAADCLATLRPVLDCLKSHRLGKRLEVVIVLPSIESGRVDQGEVADASIIPAESLYPLCSARAAGVRATTAPFIFMGETHSFPRPGMFDAVLDAHASGAAVVIPVFENENPDGLVSWAGFLNGYASWTEGRPAQDLTYAPNFNASYSRSFLIGLDAELSDALSTGDDMMGRLRSANQRVRLEPRARIGHANISSFGPWLRQRYVAGRAIASTRSKRWSLARRAVFALGSPLLPVILLARNRHGISRALKRRLTSRQVVVVLAIGTVMQAIGELAGYAAGASAKASRHYDEIEIHQLSFTRDNFQSDRSKPPWRAQ